MTPLEKLDREINLYVSLIDFRRDRWMETIDHEAHLQLLYVQRAAVIGRQSTMEELDDVAALLGAEPPAADVEQAVIESHARPARWLQTAEFVAEPPRAGWLRRWGRALRDAWLPPHPPEDPRRTYGRGGFDFFL